MNERYTMLYEDWKYESDKEYGYLEKEMHTQKEEVLEALSRIVAHSYAESFAKILQYSWAEGLEEAEKLAKQLDLGKLDFLALTENFDEYAEEYKKQKEKQSYWDIG